MTEARSWTPETEKHLRKAGWYPGRHMKAEVAEWRALMPDIFMSRAAESALLEFGGLRAEPAKASGLECAPSHFHLDPERADPVAEAELAPHRPFVSGELFPLGEIDHGHASLYIDDGGRVYMFFDELEVMGDTIEAALDALVVGRLSRKLPRAPSA